METFSGIVELILKGCVCSPHILHRTLFPDELVLISDFKQFSQKKWPHPVK